MGRWPAAPAWIASGFLNTLSPFVMALLQPLTGWILQQYPRLETGFRLKLISRRVFCMRLRPQPLAVGPEERLSFGKAALLGVQHVLAMDVYVVPFIIVTALELAVMDRASVIQSAFVAAGLATLIQSQWCMRLPVVLGPSYVPIGAILAMTSAFILIICMMVGIHLGKRGAWLRTCSVLIALSGGCVLAAFFGEFSLGAVGEASWLSRPRMAVVDFGLTFSPSAILTMLVVYAVLLAETTGTWFAVGAVIDKPLSDRQLDRGAVGEGLGCLSSALLGSTPVTGYSSNAGIIAITDVASRTAFASAGIVLAAFGLFGILSAAIASIPSAVIGGVFAVLCAVIAMNGIRVPRHEPLNERNMLVIGPPVVAALFATLAPTDFIRSLPEVVQYLFGSSVAVGAVCAVVLHQILPQSKDD